MVVLTRRGAGLGAKGLEAIDFPDGVALVEPRRRLLAASVGSGSASSRAKEDVTVTVGEGTRRFSLPKGRRSLLVRQGLSC